MNSEELQDALNRIDRGDLLSVLETREIVEAARLVANPNIEAAHHVARNLLTRRLTEMVVAAALTPQGDTNAPV